MLCTVPIPDASQALFETNTWIEAQFLAGQQDIRLRIADVAGPRLGVIRIGGASGKRLQKAQSF